MGSQLNQREGWTKLSVGLHWVRGPFAVSTIAMGDYSRKGYALYKDMVVVAEYITWEEVQQIVARLELEAIHGSNAKSQS